MIGVYKIVNIVTGDYYVGSSINIERRWGQHRKPSVWNREHKQLYVDMKRYGKNNFVIEVIEELPNADIKVLHSREQYYIEQLHPVYNTIAANTGIDTKQYMKQYYSQHADEIKQKKKQYNIKHTDERKQYYNQQCNYNGEIFTLNALRLRFWKQGIEHPTAEAKKYLIS